MTLLVSPEVGVQMHASSLLPLPDGGLLTAWFAGPREGHPDTGVWVLPQGADSPVEIAPGDQVPHWNPVLADGPDGDVWLFYKRGHRIDDWTTWVATSADRGRTWTTPRPLVDGDTSGGRGPVRQAPLLLDGMWVAPGSVESWEPPRWDCFVDLSPDGRAWQRVQVPLDHASVAGAGCIQPCLAPGRRSRLVMLTRSTAGAVFRSATDDPAVWPALTPTSLPNNNSGIAVATHPDGRLLCVHNDASGDWAARSRLVVSASADDGISWEPFAVLAEGDPDAPDGAPVAAAATGVVTSGDGEYSYPSAAVVGGDLLVTYSWQRRSIALATVPL